MPSATKRPEGKGYIRLLFSALSNFLDASSEAMRLLASNSSVLLGSGLCLIARDGGASSSLESAFCSSLRRTARGSCQQKRTTALVR